MIEVVEMICDRYLREEGWFVENEMRKLVNNNFDTSSSIILNLILIDYFD